MARDYVIDCDGHVMETQVNWAEYLEAPFQARAPRTIIDHENWPRLLVEGKLYPLPSGKGRGMGPPFAHFPSRREGMYDPKERLVDMDVEGIDVAVLFGTAVGLGLCSYEDKDFAVAMAKAYNNWLRDYCSHRPERLKGVAIVPLQDPDEAAKELRRTVTELGMVTVSVPCNNGPRTIADPVYQPLFATAQELDVPICIHSSPGMHGANPVSVERSDNFFVNHATGFAFEQMMAITLLLAAGTFDSFPKLRFAFLEAGAGWVPYWMERLEEHYEKLPGHVPGLKRSPDEIMRSEQCFYSCEPEEDLRHTLEIVGEDRIMYASDYAHWDCEFPESVNLIKQQPISDRARRKILAENASRLYRLPIPTLA